MATKLATSFGNLGNADTGTQHKVPIEYFSTLPYPLLVRGGDRSQYSGSDEPFVATSPFQLFSMAIQDPPPSIAPNPPSAPNLPPLRPSATSSVPPTPLLTTLRRTLARRQTRSAFRKLTITPPTSIDFSSNDFLSLATSSTLRSLFLAELHKHSTTFQLGSRGSRLLDGNSLYAESLERSIAAFHNAPTGILFNSGFDANAGFFACIPQDGDVIIYDEYIHASVHEGMRLSRAGACVPFAHNSPADFERVLRRQVEGDEIIQAGRRNVFVAVESVYSMDGDVAPIRGIVEVVERMLPRGNGHVVVDEAHSTGVTGPGGRGMVCGLSLENRVFARLHTFGKALSSSGAIILCSPVTREYLINYARPLIYTTFMSFPSLAAIRVAYDFMIEGNTEPLTAHLQNLITHLHLRLQTLHPRIPAPSSPTPLLRLQPQAPQSPIFSLITPHPRSLAKYCQDGGFMVRPVVPPTVPAGSERVRVCLHAGNTDADVDGLVARIGEWLDMAGGVGVVGDGEGKRREARL